MARHANCKSIDLSNHADDLPMSRLGNTRQAELRAELERDVADYLAGGGTITELDDGKIRSTYKPAFNRNPNPEYANDDH